MAIIDQLGMGPKREAVEIPGGYRVTVTPPAWSGFTEGASIDLTVGQYERYLEWNEGRGLIQNCLPELSRDQREILMSGIGPEVWDKEFKEE